MHCLFRDTIPQSGQICTVAGSFTAAGAQELAAFSQSALKIYSLQEDDGCSPFLKIVYETLLSGTVAGAVAVKGASGAVHGADRLLVSFESAKAALVEYSPQRGDLTTVSLHSFESAALRDHSAAEPVQPALLRADAVHRCAALLAYDTQLAVICCDGRHHTSVVVDLAERHGIRDVADFCFLESRGGASQPKVAVLHEPVHSWAGSVRRASKTFCVTVLALDLDAPERPSAVVQTVEKLPYDAFALLPVGGATQGIVLLCTSSVVYLNADWTVSRLALNQYGRDIFDRTLPYDPDAFYLEGGTRGVVFTPRRVVIVRPCGAIHVVGITDGARADKLRIEKVADGVGATHLCKLGEDKLFISSNTGLSLLVRVTLERVNEEATTKRIKSENGTETTSVQKNMKNNNSDDDDDDDDDDDGLNFKSRRIS